MKFTMFKESPEPCVKFVAKAKAGDPSGLVSDAVQLPLIFPPLEPLPQAASKKIKASKTAIPVVFRQV